MQDNTTWLLESKRTNVKAVTSSDKDPVYIVYGLQSHEPLSLHNNPNCTDGPNLKQTEMDATHRQPYHSFQLYGGIFITLR